MAATKKKATKKKTSRTSPRKATVQAKGANGSRRGRKRTGKKPSASASAPEVVKGELVPAKDVDADHQLIARMDEEDDRQILAELQGQALGQMVYAYKDRQGNDIQELSYAGVREVVNTLNRRGYTRIRIVPEMTKITDFTDDNGEPCIRAEVYAEDTVHGGGYPGVATELKLMALKNGKTKVDNFADRKALSKAIRAALNGMVPQEWRQVLIAQFLGKKSVRRFEMEKAGGVELPPALTDAKAKKQIERIRKLHADLHKLNPLALPKGKFDAYLAASQHDHKRLDDFIAHLGDLIVKETEAK